LPIEFDHSSGATITQLMARRETIDFYEQPLAGLGSDEAVLLRRVEPKHGAAHVPAQCRLWRSARAALQAYARNRQLGTPLDPLAHREPRSAERTRFAEA